MARILLIDDNKDSADSYAIMLSQWGHQTTAAYDAKTGLTAALNFNPDLAILDIGLPIVDGYMLAAQLRSEASLDHLHIVALTGYTDRLCAARSMHDGFDEHFIKPLDPERLRAFLERLFPNGAAVDQANDVSANRLNF